MVRRDWAIARSYRLALGLTVGAAALNVFVFYFVSETFDGVGNGQLQGAPSYFAFALVGIVIAAVVQSASLLLARRLREEQLTGTLEALTGQPVSDAELAVGVAGYPFLVSGLRATAYLLIAGLLLGVDYSGADWVGVVVVLATTTLFLAGLGLLIAALVLVVRQAEPVAALATLALAFFGGAFFPVSVLPPALEALSRVMPTRLAYDGMRAALYRGDGWADDTALLAVTTLLTVPLGVWLFGRALARQRRMGTLGQY